LCGGEEAAVADLAREYGPRIRQLALRYLKNPEDAEEIAQDVLLKTVEKVAAFRGDAALSSWLSRITFNATMSRLRQLRILREAEAPRPTSQRTHPRTRFRKFPTGPGWPMKPRCGCGSAWPAP
jgi:RNA polymerase sigma-70 factor (ECF subfamily)